MDSVKFFHCPNCRVNNGYFGEHYIKMIEAGKVPDCDYCDNDMVPGILPELKVPVE